MNNTSAAEVMPGIGARSGVWTVAIGFLIIRAELGTDVVRAVSQARAIVEVSFEVGHALFQSGLGSFWGSLLGRAREGDSRH